MLRRLSALTLLVPALVVVAGAPAHAGGTVANPTFTTGPGRGVIQPSDFTSDTVTVKGSATGAGGTLTLDLYGPYASPGAITCGGTPLSHQTQAFTGDGNYQSDHVDLTTSGYYQWIVTYSGDTGDNGFHEVCPVPLQQVSVASFSVAPDASEITAGQTTTDTATFAGYGSTLTDGYLDFYLHGPFPAQPDQATCSATYFEAPGLMSQQPQTDGDYSSQPVTLTAPGIYQWLAAYRGSSGTGNAPPASVDCVTPSNQVTVVKATPAISSTATTAAAGMSIEDTATVSGGYQPSGTVTFTLHGSCETPALQTFDVALSADGTASTVGHGPSRTGLPVGDYHWVAAYGGDASNAGVDPDCGAEGETSTVTLAQPTVTTTATGAPLGATVSDSAVLAGGFAPTGTITFSLYSTCAGETAPLFTHSVPVTGNGTYSSGAFAPSVVGDLFWTATYSGDSANAEASESCGATGETSTVGKAAPLLGGTASASVPVGGSIRDAATLTRASAPTGTVTFAVWGPAAPTCAGAPLFTGTVPLTGTTAGSPAFVTSLPGTYSWAAAYSGDASNAAAFAACSASQQVVVTPVAPTVAVTAISVGNHTFAVSYATHGRAGVPVTVVATARTRGGAPLTRTATSATGSFTFAGVGNSKPYALTLTVTSVDGTGAATGLPVVTPGRVPPVTVKLSSSRVHKGTAITITGTVGEKSDPLAHRTVVLVQGGKTRTTTTNSKGKYSFTFTPTKSGQVVVTSFASVGRSAVGKATTKITVV